MMEQTIIGWDIGGAHLKVAALEGGVISHTQYYATPLWQGLATLDAAIESIKASFKDSVCTHVLTMTGELVDLFSHRRAGVVEIIRYVLAKYDNADNFYIYAGKHGFILPADAASLYAHVASANWHATASLLAQEKDSGYLIDIGTTTTDIIPFQNQQVLSQGYTDQQRLQTGELIYTGVARTAVMAIVNQVVFKNKWQFVAAEYFATMADVYRLTGDLDERFDDLPAADAGGKSPQDSRRRLARMLGTDLQESDDADDWLALARYIAEQQFTLIEQSFSRVLEDNSALIDKTLVAAGIGRFIITRLSQRHHCNIIDFEDIVGLESAAHKNNCATAIALARLFWTL